MMLDPQTLAAILLALRIIAAGLLIAVIVRQIHNLRNLRTDYPAVRMVVFLLTLTLLIGQIIPMILDSVVLLYGGYPGRAMNPHILGVSYAINNALKDVIIGALLCFLYFRLGKPLQTAIYHELDGKVPQPENTPQPDK